MKPWFIKEDNVIPFPKKDTGVVKLPNINAYPDFLSGVQDLQNHLKQTALLFYMLVQQVVQK